MKKINDFCNGIADALLIAIVIGIVALCFYAQYRYDVNVVKEGVKESKTEELR
jgi:hypothetical protein